MYTIFPNSLLLVQPDHMSFFTVNPLAPEETAIHGYTLLRELPKTARAEAYWEKNIAILHAAIEEDLERGGSIQSGLASGANEHFTFGRYEQSLTWFHDTIAAEIGG
ncbi:MAG: hypothetical protein HYZ27_10580 [Deltaproteobacteria bacterium]|nr:hypothetical protein [Deltaproteobacteria bacterium]